MLKWLLPAVVASSAFLVGLSIPLARALGIVDAPGAIKIHSQPTPRFGGVGIVAAIALWGGYTGSLYGGALWGLLLIALTGALDDRYSLSPKVRLAAELVAGVLLGLHFWSSLGWIGLALGVLLVPVMANSVNLIDGMNGLAAGSAMISAAGLAALLWTLQLEATLALVLVGSLAGFLLWNYPKAKSFMGDCGSLSIGYLLALLLMHSATQGLTAFLAAGVMVGFPIFDMLAGIIRRWRRGKPIFDGDRDHTYDRLDQLYVRAPVKTVLIIWMLTAFLVGLGLLISKVALGLGALLAILLLLFLFGWAYRLGSL